ncbi:MAG: DoxX family protein [Planctomycetes bacterium]|nr:DoxX family protein [Planctomycetota bacterium]
MATVVSLVVLRVAIGWLFFAGAWEKYHNAKFSSEPFLKQAKGPLAPYYLAGVPDVHGFRKYIEVPRQQVPEPKPEEPNAAKAAPKETAKPQADLYQQWEKQIVQDWGREQQAVSAHFGFDEKQNEQATLLLRFYEGKLDAYLDGHANDLAGFRHDLYRMIDKKPKPELPVDADMEQRRGAALAVRQWVADTGRKFRQELVELATAPQLKLYGEMRVTPSSLESFDRFLIYTHLAIGFCLLVGLLTRLASFGAAAFLFTVVATQPPWVDGSLSWISGPQAVMYQAILMLACVVLMTSGAGRWAGLDYFIHNWRQLFTSQKEQG